MESNFSLNVSNSDKKILFELARLSILNHFAEKKNFLPELSKPPSPLLEAQLGAFVTLRINAQLRGCIGNLFSHDPLYKTVSKMAQAAAFSDRRFPPLQKSEYDTLDLEISIMGPITPCKDISKIELGRHGLILRGQARQGLLLPQVPLEFNWTLPEFLQHLCIKAGLPPKSWEQAWIKPGIELYWFEAVVLEESN